MPPQNAIASLGEFELLVLLATLSLGDTAYPVSIASDIETRTGRKASRTAVLITLERLEDKGLLTSRYWVVRMHCLAIAGVKSGAEGS